MDHHIYHHSTFSKQNITKFFQTCFICSFLLLTCTSRQNSFANRDRLFDSDWRFYRGDASGAEQATFDESNWRVLDLPHDWSIEDLPENPRGDQIGPFSKESPGQSSTGHVMGGTGWYRKNFTLDKADAGKQVSIYFDGVYMESTVWVNGQQAGYHPYGYTPFFYNITPFLSPAGEENILAVKVENIGQNSRWYSGSGIYRHVWLTVTHPVHVAMWGTYITTPEISQEQASIHITNTLQNDGDIAQDVQLKTTILNPDGKVVGQVESGRLMQAGEKAEMTQTVIVKRPQLWSLETPSLYSAKVDVMVNGDILDRTTTTFGIRSIEFSTEKGFLLNGQPVLLKGGNMHHDNGPLGAATIDRAEERRVELMKKFGFNAIRTSHNPPSKQFLDACDRLGMLVLDEAFDHWQRPKNPQDYHRFFNEWYEKDLAAMLLRDRNHPSIFLWSFGNEISERADPAGLEIAQKLINIIKQYDKTRPVTQAICSFWEEANKGKTWEDTAPAFALLDVCGYNYQWQRYEEDFQQFTERIICGTESIAGEAFENWQQVKKHPYVIGDFLWTAMDYFGEASLGHAVYEKENEWGALPWPWYNANCGDIDVCGFKKPSSFYRDVVWGLSNLEMAVHEPVPEGKKEKVSFWGWPNEEQSWNWPGAEDQELAVTVYSNYPQVRLELNSQVIGTESVSEATKLKAMFQAPYRPGELKVIGIKDGQDVETKILTTTGDPAGIRLSVDRSTIRADRNDLAYVTAEVVDAHGNRVPNAKIPITFSIKGVGEIAAVDNGNPTDIKSFQAPHCTTFRGRCLVILRPMGEIGAISLKAEAEGLEASVVRVKVR